MNNDSTPTPAAVLPSTQNDNTTTNTTGAAESTARRDDTLSPVQKRFKSQVNKKLEFVDGMMRNLDMLVYVELAILYYME
jgi:hypothetical protein